jgi:hypothetical protein
MDMKKLLDTFSQIEGKQTLTESESTSPFNWKTNPSQLPKKPGETAGFDSKKISTGTVYSRKPTKDKTDTVKESANFDESKLEQILARYNEDMEHIGLYSSGVDHSLVLELLKKGDVESAAEEIAYTFSDEDGGEPRGRDDAQYEDLKSDLENLVNPADFDNISHGTDPKQRDQDELSMLKHFMQYGKEPQPGSQMASIKDRLSAKGMAEAKDDSKTKLGALFDEIAGYDDEGFEMLDACPVWSQMFDQTGGDVDKILATATPKKLAIMIQELEDVVDGLNGGMFEDQSGPGIQAKYLGGEQFKVMVNGETYQLTATALEYQLQPGVKDATDAVDSKGMITPDKMHMYYFVLAAWKIVNVNTRKKPNRSTETAIVNYIDQNHEDDLKQVAQYQQDWGDDLEEGKGDGNLANNAKPYDKVTKGDVIAGRLGKDEKGGKKYSVQECYDGSMSPMSGATQEESNLSVSTNMGTNSPLNVSVTATGGAARELMQMLRLAGLGSSDEMSDTTEPEVVIGAEEMEEDYANAPDEKYSTVDNPGNDLHRPKGTYPKVAGGDNPMAMREADELAALEKQLFEELSAIKIIKK